MTHTDTFEIEGDGSKIFVIFRGVKIAKRGHPDTPQAGTWVSLEPGWTVTGGKTGPMEIVYEPGLVQ
jgi:hypothetical protein